MSKDLERLVRDTEGLLPGDRTHLVNKLIKKGQVSGTEIAEARRRADGVGRTR